MGHRGRLMTHLTHPLSLIHVTHRPRPIDPFHAVGLKACTKMPINYYGSKGVHLHKFAYICWLMSIYNV